MPHGLRHRNRARNRRSLAAARRARPMSHGSVQGASTAATYVLIHGAGGGGWYWNLREAELGGLRRDVRVLALPVEDDSAGLSAYADVVIEAIGDRDDLVVVAQSFGGYIAPIVCQRGPATL